MIAIQVVAFLFGVLLIGWSVLLYESEERKIDETLAEWWIEIDDVARSSVSKNLALLRLVGGAVSSWLTAVFGSKMLSVEAVSASMALSLSSLLLFFAVGGIVLTTGDPILDTLPIALCVLALSISTFHLAVTPSRANLRRAVAVGVVLFLPIFEFIGFYYASDWLPLEVVAIPVGTLLGVASDFLIIVLIRIIARVIARAPSFFVAVAGAVLSTVLGLFLTLVPLLWLYRAGVDSWWRLAIALAAATNLYTSIMAVATAMVLATVILQRAVWPLVQRPLYAAWRFKLLQNRKFLFYAGSALLLVAMPGALYIVEAATKLLR